MTLDVMAKVLLLATALLATPLAALAGASTPEAASSGAAHGKALYQQYCASCHGLNGHGEFNWQNRERAAPALDDSGHAWHHEDAQLVNMILDKPLPDSRMPAWRGVLSEHDAEDLVLYVKTLWSPYIRDNCQGAKHMQCMSRR